MTDTEALILSAAHRIKIRNTSELAKRCGIPNSTMHYKMRSPGTLRLFDLNAIDNLLHLTPEEMYAIVKSSR